MKRILLSTFLLMVGLAGISARADVSTATAITAGRMGVYAWNSGLLDSTATLNTDLTYIAATGAGLLRFQGDFWASVETASGVFTYTKLIAAINLATGTYGMDVQIPMPISAAWTPIGETCPQTDPYFGISVPCTHFPTNDMGLIYRFYKNVAQQTCGSKVYYEIWNEPDFSYYWKAALFPATTDYILVATTAYTAIKDGCPSAQVLLGGISNPRGATPAAYKTHYTGNHYFSELLTNLGGNATNYIYNVHIYPDSDGGNMDFYTALSSMVAMCNANGIPVGNQAFHITETAKFGGSYTTSDHDAEEVWKSSEALQAYAIGLSTPSVRRITYHNLKDFDFSLLNSDRTSRYSYLVMTRMVAQLIGYTPQGDVGGGSAHIYKFSNGNVNRYIAWAISGTTPWALNPVKPVNVTDTHGLTTAQSVSTFSPYTLTTSPILVEETQYSKILKGVILRGVTF